MRCRSLFLCVLVVGCGGHAAPPNPDASPPIDLAAQIDAGADLSTAADSDLSSGVVADGGALGLGTVSAPTSVDCAGAGWPGDTCQTVTVTCADVEPAIASIAITTPATPIGTVVIHGPGGGTHFYNSGSPSFVQKYVQAGLRVVQLHWDTDWEASGAGSITKAACRPATIFHYAATQLVTPGPRQPFCLHGSSGGSGATAFAIARYGLKNEVDHVTFSFGPVFSRIDYGCDPSSYTGPARDLCPEDTHAGFTYTPNAAAMMNEWEQTTGCPTSPSPTDVPHWRDDSILVPDADTSFPATSLSFYYCVAPANSGAGQGSFFIDAVQSSVTKSVGCFTDCSEENLVQADVDAMAADLVQHCAIH